MPWNRSEIQHSYGNSIKKQAGAPSVCRGVVLRVQRTPLITDSSISQLRINRITLCSGGPWSPFSLITSSPPNLSYCLWCREGEMLRESALKPDVWRETRTTGRNITVTETKVFSTHVKLRRVDILMKLHLRAIWGATCHMGSHSVTCYPTQVNTPRLNPSQRLVLDLPTPEGWKAELT